MQSKSQTMKQAYVRILLFILVLSGFANTVTAYGPIDSISDRQAAIIREKLVARIQENQRLIKEGRASEANYIVYDEDNPPVTFFKYFTSENARKLWVKRGFLAELIMQDDINLEVKMLNSWIGELRKTYIEPTAYKDVKIYFVVSGIYNYDNLDAKEPDIDWNKRRSISFTEKVKDAASTDFTEKENEILYSIFNKVSNDPANQQLVNIVNNEKYIICFLFNLYKYFPANITQFQWFQGGEIASAGMKNVEIKMANSFVTSGYFFSTIISRDLINGLARYNASHMDATIGDAPKDLASRNTFLAQQIRNVYTYFSTLGGPGTDIKDCNKDVQLRDRLEKLYKNPLPNSTGSIAPSLTDLSVDTRKCLLKQLSGSTFCGDGDNWFLRLNHCENLIVDIITSTPPEQRRQLLDYLNEKNDVLRGLVNKVHDEGPGSNHYSTIVNLLSQYAYDVYKTDINMLKSGNNLCSWLSYNPEEKYNTYSHKVIVSYDEGSDLYFQFRKYSGLCHEQEAQGNGTIDYSTKSFHARPFDFIGIIPETDLPFKFTLENQEKNTIGQKIFVPAIMLQWSIKKTATFNAKKDMMMAVNVATFFMGGSVFSVAGSTLGKILVATEGVTTLGNAIVNSDPVRAKILSREGGQEFLSTIDNINMLSSASTITYLTLAKLGRSVKFWKNYRSDPDLTSSANFRVIDEGMTKLEDAMAAERLITKEITYPRSMVGLIDDAIKQAAPYIDELKDLGINVRRMTQAETDVLLQVKNANDVQHGVNIARADIVLENGESYTRWATSGYPIKKRNILTNPPGAPYPKEGNTIFGNLTFRVDGIKRFNDSEVKILEEFAFSQGLKPGVFDNVITPVMPNVRGKMTITSQLCPCPSCTKVLKAFKKIFPNLDIEIITSSLTKTP